jgi:riboflavin kinase / FMN adenylyltransferase
VKILKNIDQIPVLKNPVVTVGSFDGVHIGHKAIIQRTIDLARENKGESVAVTFSPHPQAVLHPDSNDFYILTTNEEKSFLLDSLGIDYLIIIPFTKEFASLPYDHFVEKYIAGEIHTNTLVIGYDHHFGSNREGTITQLSQLGRKYNFHVEEVTAQFVKGTTVSSTKIRKALIAGEVSQANTFLGYPYFISGKVVKGNGLGVKLGFPTANIEMETKAKLLPADGAYAARVEVSGHEFGGMINIGMRPTIGGTSRVAEVNIFDFSSNIYGENINVHFIERLREEIRFNDVKELHEQLLKDKAKALKILSGKQS